MKTVEITEVGIDDLGRTFVRPAVGDFEMVYRAAMEVYWDSSTRRLSHPKPPREWTAVDWYRQILAAVADEYEVLLRPSQRTTWTNVSEEERKGMLDGQDQ